MNTRGRSSTPQGNLVASAPKGCNDCCALQPQHSKGDSTHANLIALLRAVALDLLDFGSCCEEPSWRSTMPREQAPEFNRYITLMNGANERLLPLVVVLGLEVDKLQLRLGILATLALWNIQALHVDDYIRYGTKPAKRPRRAARGLAGQRAAAAGRGPPAVMQFGWMLAARDHTAWHPG